MRLLRAFNSCVKMGRCERPIAVSEEHSYGRVLFCQIAFILFKGSKKPLFAGKLPLVSKLVIESHISV